MSENSKIEWTDHTFNPWWGCVKVSPGCANCYAERDARRFGTGWGPSNPRRLFGEKHWAEPLKWDHKAKSAGRRARVFCASMCDVFEEGELQDTEREKLWALIGNTPNLDWLLLTKRPENMALFMTLKGSRSNVWCGTSVEDQQRADERIPWLLKTPAAVRFLSCEPLLGAVDLFKVGDREWDVAHGWQPHTGPEGANTSRIDWVIVGGESGPKARPMHPAWARQLRDQCVRAGVAFHFKQHGEWKPKSQMSADDVGAFWDAAGRINSGWGTIEQSGEFYETGTPWNGHDDDGDGAGAVMLRVGKKYAGRTLDGREWDELPLSACGLAANE